jgi:type I restriction enzyme S subunit
VPRAPPFEETAASEHYDAVVLTCGGLKHFKVAVPPLENQAHLVAQTEEATHAVTNGISRVQREISLLAEYRSRLVSDVVIGRLDVRDAAIQIAVEVDVVEAPEEAVGESDTEIDDVEFEEAVA